MSGTDLAIFVVDDSPHTFAQIARALGAIEVQILTFADIDGFLATCHSGHHGCLLLGSAAKDRGDLDFFQLMAARQVDLPIIQVVESGDVPEAVRALQRGAADVLQKPLTDSALFEAVRRALEIVQRQAQRNRDDAELGLRLARLTRREREVLDRILSGYTNKGLAQQLGISRRTADFHRANILRKMQAESVPQLVHMVLTSGREPIGAGAAPPETVRPVQQGNACISSGAVESRVSSRPTTRSGSAPLSKTRGDICERLHRLVPQPGQSLSAWSYEVRSTCENGSSGVSQPSPALQECARMISRLLPTICLLLCLATAWAQEPVTLTSATQPTTQPATAAAPSVGPERERPFDFLHNNRLTGDWGGARPWLEDHGITLDLGLTTIYQHNARGGLQTRHAHRVSGSYDLEGTFDFEKLGLWQGGTLYALAEGGWDEGISRYVGDLFGVNGDAAGEQEIQLSELWFEQAFWDEKLRVRFGKLDLTVDFDTNAFANDETTQFLNGSLINTGNVPFPEPGQGIQFVATPMDWLYFSAGVADAEADVRETGINTAFHGQAHTFSVYEFGLTPTWQTSWGELPSHYRFGMWYDPQPKEAFFDDLGGRLRTIPVKRDDIGFYMSHDQMVFREDPLTAGDEQGLGVFFRYGYAHDDVNTVEHFWSVGAQYQGLIPTRDDDVLALGVAQGMLSERMRRSDADPHQETALETYYRIQLFPWLTLSPDFQWILRPGGENGRDAFVAGIRLQAAF